MFNNQNKPIKKGATSRDAAVTILTSGCHFSGKLYCRGSSRIAGRIEGTIVSEGLLIVEDEALIRAEITTEEAVIQGRVQGRLEAKNRVELCPSSHFEGDLNTPILIVKEGAQFNGRAIMNGASAASERGSSASANRFTAVTGSEDSGQAPEIAARTMVEA